MCSGCINRNILNWFNVLKIYLLIHINDIKWTSVNVFVAIAEVFFLIYKCDILELYYFCDIK